MGPKKRKAYTHKKQHIMVSTNPVGRPQVRAKQMPLPGKAQLASMLWTENYWELLDKMLDDHPELAQIVTNYIAANKSRYEKRLQDEQLQSYLRKQKFKLAGVLQTILCTGHHIRGTQLLKLMKSGVLLREHAAAKRWTQDVKSGFVLSKETTKSYMQEMLRSKPVPDGDYSSFLVEVCIDQLHLRQGCRKGGYHRSVERADEDGEKVTVKSITVMNMHEYPVDNNPLGLTKDEEDWIRQHGPYTEHKSEVYKELDYSACCDSLYDFWEEDCELLQLVMAMPEMEGATDLDVLLALAARPQYSHPPTHHIIHKPKIDADTNNYDDTQTTWNWTLEKFPDAGAIIVDCDGQANGMLCNAKSIRPERYVACIPKAADCHGECHIGYSQHELYMPDLGQPLSDAMGFKKIEVKPKDMDKDRFNNHKYLNIGMAIASKLVLIRKFGLESVSNPRRLQETVECHAGYKILFFYKLQCGGPQLMFQRAQRSNRADRINQCWAWGWHTCRCVHKTNYIQYAVQRAHAIR